ncbi:MAG: hypothetical protein R3F07_03300 [Opitutaceae bacterium]
MMDLTAEQKVAVGKWVEEGASVADVQKRLKEEFQIGITFMDARFLIDDLELDLKDKVKPAETPDFAAPATGTSAAREAGTADSEVFDLEADGTGAVTVEVDKITRPGTVVSGNVVFSDGVKASWALDQLGRLALDPGAAGYRPSEDDIAVFQQELSRQLQKQGF